MSVLESSKIESHNKLPKLSIMLKENLKISIPAALETFFVGLVGLIDTLMVSSLGEEAIAAISISQQPVFITLALCVGLNVGVIAIISRRHGEKDRVGANTCLKNSILLGIVIGLAMSVLAIVIAKPLILLAGAEDDTVDMATTYFQIVSVALVFNYVRLIICSALRACGKTTITLTTNIIANLLNVFLNYCLITGRLGFPALGVTGAAIATICGNLVACIIAFFAIYHSKGFLSIRIRENWRFDKNTIKSIFNVSSNAFIDQVFVRIGFFITAIIVNNLGTVAVAINAIVNSVISLAFNITDGLSTGCAAIVGRCLGRKRVDEAFAQGRISQIISISICVVMTIIVMVFRYPLAQLFSDNPDIIAKAVPLLLFSGFVMFPQSIQWVTNGVLRGAGDTKFTARVALVSILFIRPIASYIFCYPLGLGVAGALIGLCFQQIVRMIMNIIRFENLKWIKHQL